MGGFLKELRKEKGMLQEQLAEFLNVSGMTADHRLKAVAWTALGLAFGVMVVGLLFTSGILHKSKPQNSGWQGKNNKNWKEECNRLLQKPTTASSSRPSF